jgi:hypothetical protein
MSLIMNCRDAQFGRLKRFTSNLGITGSETPNLGVSNVLRQNELETPKLGVSTVVRPIWGLTNLKRPNSGLFEMRQQIMTA